MDEKEFIRKLLNNRTPFSITSKDFAAYTGRRHCDIKRAIKTYVEWQKKQGRDDHPIFDGNVYKLRINHVQGLYRRQPKKWKELVNSIETFLFESKVSEFKKWKSRAYNHHSAVYIGNEQLYKHQDNMESKRIDEMLDVLDQIFYEPFRLT